MAKLLICEPYLYHFSGHCFEYCVSTAEAARGLGYPTQIFASKKLDLASVKDEDEIYPWFGLPTGLPSPTLKSLSAISLIKNRIPPFLKSALMRLSLKSKYLGNEKLGFGPELLRAFAQAQATQLDHAFLPTTYLDEFASLIWAVNESNIPLPLIHVVMRRDPREPFLESSRHPSVPRLAKLLREIEDSEKLKKQIRLYCDTEDLITEYCKLSALEFTLLPIPFRAEKIEQVRNLARQKSDPSLKRVVFIGEARSEKGFQYLPDIIRVADQPGIQWIIQASGSAAQEDPAIRQSLRELREFTPPKIKILAEPLSPDEYYQLLLSADLVLLPYLSEAYLGRSSGVFAEAVTAQIPTVVPAQTWMGSQAQQWDCGVLFQNPKSLGEAVKIALARLNELNLNCKAASVAWSKHNTPKKLVEKLFNV